MRDDPWTHEEMYECAPWPHYDIRPTGDGRFVGGFRSGRGWHATAYHDTEEEVFQSILSIAPVLTRRGVLPKDLAKSLEDLDRWNKERRRHGITIRITSDDLKLLAEQLNDEIAAVEDAGPPGDKADREAWLRCLGWMRDLWYYLAKKTPDFVPYEGYKKPSARWRGLPDPAPPDQA